MARRTRRPPASPAGPPQRAAPGYRDRALRLLPWVCARCGRTFTHANVRELTVHHRDHDHDHNPPDGSNWELLCLYCHDNQHQRELEHRRTRGAAARREPAPAKGRPLTALRELWSGKSPTSTDD